jgi:aspartyl/asparaginyl beta-hydroxylase (cupin superfamily)
MQQVPANLPNNTTASWYKPGSKFYSRWIVPLLLLPIRSLEAINIICSGNQPIYPNSRFSWISTLENNHELILAELNAVLQEKEKIPLFTDLSEEQKRITAGDDWRVFLLIGYGKQIPLNAMQCKTTMSLLKNVTGLQSAMFSILKPGAVIKPHRGPYNGLLRYHLGLIIPEAYSDCGIRIDKTIYNWQKGQSIVFDDSFEHEVWNNTAQYRVVLFIDFERPLPFPVNGLNRLFLSALARSPFINTIIERAMKPRG